MKGQRGSSKYVLFIAVLAVLGFSVVFFGSALRRRQAVKYSPVATSSHHQVLEPTRARHVVVEQEKHDIPLTTPKRESPLRTRPPATDPPHDNDEVDVDHKEEEEPNADAEATHIKIKAAHEMKAYTFFRMQEAKTKLWLSRPVDTNQEKSLDAEKVFKIEYHKKYKAYSVKGHTRMHLTCELNNKVTIDRMWARSFEQWKIHFEEDGTVSFESRRNSMFVRLGKGEDTLMADVTHEKATKWILFGERSAHCFKHSGKAAAFENQCWGSTPTVRSQLKLSNETYPIFGSPKPVTSLLPLDENEPFDSVTIASRTLTNWASIDHIQPLILTTDKTTHQLVDKVNENVPNHIDIRDEYEIQKKFDQPTYRGLFDSALTKYPKAKAVIYSNSDILFTPSLPETIDRVSTYVERERERKIASGSHYKVRGWMIVGQRVNHVVPAKWQINPDNKSWVTEIEKNFAKSGELFESDAEDYFIVSRELFNWMSDIPDFVVGGVAFDNWITNKVNKLAIKGEAVIIDASKTITALHQNHGHNNKQSHKHPKSEYNSQLAARHGGWSLGHTADAPYATERRHDGSITVYDKHRLLYK